MSSTILQLEKHNQFADNALSIGSTPLIKLNRLVNGKGATVELIGPTVMINKTALTIT